MNRVTHLQWICLRAEGWCLTLAHGTWHELEESRVAYQVMLCFSNGVLCCQLVFGELWMPFCVGSRNRTVRPPSLVPLTKRMLEKKIRLSRLKDEGGVHA